MMHRVFGFNAVAQAGYDCSFMVMYPLHVKPTDDQIASVCQHAVADANKMHGGINVTGRTERYVSIKG